MLGRHFFELLCLCEDQISIKNYFCFWTSEIAAKALQGYPLHLFHFARVRAAIQWHVPFILIFRTKSTLSCQISLTSFNSLEEAVIVKSSRLEKVCTKPSRSLDNWLSCTVSRKTILSSVGFEPTHTKCSRAWIWHLRPLDQIESINFSSINEAQNN